MGVLPSSLNPLAPLYSPVRGSPAFFPGGQATQTVPIAPPLQPLPQRQALARALDPAGFLLNFPGMLGPGTLLTLTPARWDRAPP